MMDLTLDELRMVKYHLIGTLCLENKRTVNKQLRELDKMIRLALAERNDNVPKL